MSKLNKSSKKPNFYQNSSTNKSTNKDISVTNKNQTKGKQNEANGFNHVDLKNLNKKITDDSFTNISRPVQENSKYKRRAVTSNWERYDEPEETSNTCSRGVDFNELSKSKARTSSQFMQLQEEKEWLETTDATLTIDCHRLEQVLSQLPVHIRLDLSPKLAPSSQENGSKESSPSLKFRPFFTGLSQSLKKVVPTIAANCDADPNIKFCLPLNETPESLPHSLMDNLFDSNREEEEQDGGSSLPKPLKPSRICDGPPSLPNLQDLFKGSAPLPLLKNPSSLSKPPQPRSDDDLDALLNLAKVSLEQQGKGGVRSRNLLDEWLQKLN